MDKEFKFLLGALSVVIALCVLLFLAFAGADITGCTVQKGIYLG